MYKEKANLTDIKFVLDNLCDETLEELKLMFGEKYKTAAFDEIKWAVEKYVIKLKCTHKPVGVFGLVPLRERQWELVPTRSAHPLPLGRPCKTHSVLHPLPLGRPTTAGIFLLTTENLCQGNIVTFLKQARKQVDIWTNEYDLILDNCCKKNEKIKKWLRLLGFKPSEYQNDKFRIYYRGDIGLYYE